MNPPPTSGLGVFNRGSAFLPQWRDQLFQQCKKLHPAACRDCTATVHLLQPVRNSAEHQMQKHGAQLPDGQPVIAILLPTSAFKKSAIGVRTKSSNPPPPEMKMSSLMDQVQMKSPDAVDVPPRLKYDKRDLVFLLPLSAAMYAVFNGMQNVLLPAQVQSIAGDGKVNALALLAALGSVAAAIANPLSGALSDRTRSRFGRRAPWLIVGAMISALAMLLLAGAHSLVLLCATYCLVMLSMGSIYTVANAIIPDRIPAERRGTASAVMGAGMPIGMMIGVNLVTRIFTSPLSGYLALGAILVFFAGLFVFCTRDEPLPQKSTKPSRVPVGEAVTDFFSALRSSDFRWAFISRAAYMLSFYSVAGYLLYTMQDYIDPDTIPMGDAVAAVGTLGTINAIMLLVGTVAGGWLSDFLGRRKPLAFGSAILSGLSLLIPVFYPTFAGMAIMQVVLGFSVGVYLAVDTVILTLVLPAEESNARDLGLLALAQTGAQVLATFAAAMVINHLGGYQSLFIFAIACTVLGALTLIPIRGVR